MTLNANWVMAPAKKAMVVGVADMVASNDAAAELVTYSLGSCLGITAYDPVKKVGGLLHLMLPSSSIDPGRAVGAPHMFADTGVPRLFQAIYSLGGERFRLVVKVAGGAQFLDPHRTFNIGERNLQAVRHLLTHHGFNVQAHDVGGVCSRTLRLNLTTGHVAIHSPGQPPYLL